MDVSLSDLSDAVDNNNEKSVIEHLTCFSDRKEKDIELENNDLPQRILALNNDNITKIFLELAADWCKVESNRKVFTYKSVIDCLLALTNSKDEALVLGAIRALGNICYDNPEARKLIGEKGLEAVIAMLASDNKNHNNFLIMKVCGFLVNILVDADDMGKLALKLNLLKIIEDLLKTYSNVVEENELMYTFLLTILNSSLDFIEELNIRFPESLCCILVDLLKHDATTEISVMCVEILHNQAENDEIKMLLAENGVCEVVYKLIEQYRSRVIDEDSRIVMKMACDMIVTILTGDDCMNLLYGNGEGEVYKNMTAWLDSEDPDLLSTGILAIGNFARKDTHCIQMVQHGISKKLLSLLSNFNTSTSDIKVQHALLSTLKNLIIPAENKPIVLEQGLIDVIYPMIQIEQYLVLFKLLGTFRMAIDGQEKAALDLISRTEFIEKLAFWCYNSDHLGVRGEIPRLLAWMIKHCHSFKPMKNLIQVKDIVKCLVEMVASNHAVMQNESFYALNLLSIGCSHSSESSNGINGVSVNEADLYEQLIAAEIGNNLSFVINKYSGKMDKHTIANLLTLLEQLFQSTAVIGHLKSTSVHEALGKLLTNSNASALTEQLNSAIEQIRC